MQKVLIITYYWPPAGGPGVQRWLKFVKYLPEFGFEPWVYIPQNPHYPLEDESLLKEVPERVKILKRPITEPYRWASVFSKKQTKTISSGIIQEEKRQSLLEKMLLWVRGNLFIPDARKNWVKPSVRYLSQILSKENITTVITSGPPHSLHLIGMGLKKRHPDLQWITDFRDPWTSIGYHKKLRLTASSQRKHKRLESDVLNGADKIVVTSNTTKEEFEQLTQKPIKVITNGYESGDVAMGLDQKFTVSHIGSLLTDRNPELLWQVLSTLVKEHADFAEHLKIQLGGTVSEQVLQSVRQYGLEAHIEILGYVPHGQVQKLQQAAQVLLLLEIDSVETRGIIPGKLFEYLKAKRPILAMGPEQWEGGQIVEMTKSGRYVTSNGAQSLKEVLLKWFRAYQEGSLTINPTGIEHYHRRALTEQLANFIIWESS
ncbi:glycosyltransferase family 4 protein [Allomuricauda sp. SCSIO 65647]|uniref:glycosyltransferase family 4 protein n=1 Tax=Allomuricauda sp. SCSIO 65647 TaxID=2908843 RepID=UPI001F288FC7|nr:glycosyltransferase family 4 protein [Muricauda sp. SCSIO 65647]UJH67162.1 glycosyltransferase family 4 protein [Muricauda sp. SCSIO 65647]